MVRVGRRKDCDYKEPEEWNGDARNELGRVSSDDQKRVCSRETR